MSFLASYNFDGFSRKIVVNIFHHFSHTFSTHFRPLINTVFGVVNTLLNLIRRRHALWKVEIYLIFLIFQIPTLSTFIKSLPALLF